MKIESGFALLDVKKGRNKLKRHFDKGRGEIPVTITGYIKGVWGQDDGISREFHVDVSKVSLREF